MRKNELSEEMIAEEKGMEPRAAEEPTDPEIRKILQRNRKAKLRLATRLLAMGLGPAVVEKILNIVCPRGPEGAGSTHGNREKK